MSPFPFRRLPELVRCKILRQYVGSFQKMAVLDDFPDLSLSPDSWLNGSETFREFVDLVSSIADGFYLPRRKWWDDGFFVEKGPDGLKFTHFSLRNSYGLVRYLFENQRLEALAPLERGSDFLREFSENFHRLDLKVLLSDDGGFFYVNYGTETLFWKDGREYALDRSVRLPTDDGDFVSFDPVRLRTTTTRGGKRRCEEPTEVSLRGASVTDGGGRVSPHKSAYEIGIGLAEGDTKVRIELRRMYESVATLFDSMRGVIPLD